MCKTSHIVILVIALFSQRLVFAEKPTNKLLFQYRFFYLPFSVDFKEGRDQDEILPMLKSPDGDRLIKAEELQTLDDEWTELRSPLRKKSLFLNTAIEKNQSIKISSQLFIHKVPLSRGPFDSLSINEKIEVQRILATKSPEIQANYKQLQFFKQFIAPEQMRQKHFFLVSASWCESCKEYQALIEHYFKTFFPKGIAIHSLVIDDPKEQIFDHPFLRNIFPNASKYSHKSIPRFLLVDGTNEPLVVLEEGEALESLYKTYFAEKKGFLDSKASLFTTKPPPKLPQIRRSLASPSAR